MKSIFIQLISISLLYAKGYFIDLDTSIDFPQLEELGLLPDESQKFVFYLAATGVQQYACNKSINDFSFVAPEARLFDEGVKVGDHFARKDEFGGAATWEINAKIGRHARKKDYSFVTTKKVNEVDSPEGKEIAISWLMNKKTSGSNHGVMEDISFVLRINTVGGVAPPSEQCKKDKEVVNVKYNALYLFFADTELSDSY
ncbi:hypothetical protein HDU92_001909 [Lobulomyces angularis]|nr:hypothetical protein HDU92_001909 [Lobulomyces angularis]